MRLPCTAAVLTACVLSVPVAIAQQAPSVSASPSPNSVNAARPREVAMPPADGPVAPGQPAALAPNMAVPGSECSHDTATPSESACGRGGFYADVDYLYWWLKKGTVPPLITHGDPNDTPTGALGQHGTTVLFGDSGFGADQFSGGRFTAGYGFGDDGRWGVETTWLFLQQRHSSFGASSSGAAGSGTLAIPFFNSDGGFEDANVVALAGTEAGAIYINLTQRLWGAEANLRLRGPSGDNFRLSGLVGFRFLDLQESLDLQTFSAALPTSTGITTALGESFATRNRFYGGQIGGQIDYIRGPLCLSALAKVALGDNDEVLKINGITINTDPIAGTVVAPGGLFSGPTNMGNHGQNHFAVLPEVGLTLGYHFSDKVCATVGYTFLYINEVVRPGDQIDRLVSFQANTHPGVLFRQTDFWAQGVSFGLQYHF